MTPREIKERAEAKQKHNTAIGKAFLTGSAFSYTENQRTVWENQVAEPA